MPLLLPRDHPARPGLRHAPAGVKTLRIGIVNIMPRLEAYEPLLLHRLAGAPEAVEPVFVRLETHVYSSSDQAHLDRFYRPFSEAGRLDGLIITGAPVEELPFEAVHYWSELTEILAEARRTIRSTLGICWGGLALGALLDVPKLRFQQKLFGVFEHRVLLEGDPLMDRDKRAAIRCAHSRHSGSDDDALERAAAAGVIRLLAHSPDVGYGVFATRDYRFVAHLGHPEYEADRLVFEWNRDQREGRTDVPRPRGVDLERPATTWRNDNDAFFQGWLALLHPAPDS